MCVQIKYIAVVDLTEASTNLRKQSVTFLCIIILIALVDVSRGVSCPGGACVIDKLTSRMMATASCSYTLFSDLFSKLKLISRIFRYFSVNYYDISIVIDVFTSQLNSE